MPQEGKCPEHAFRPTHSIAEEAEVIEGKSEWLNNDLSYLIQSPLAVQLRAILGAESAESFLHPTIKDHRKIKANARFQIPKKPGALDAHQLWNDLRASSNSKLLENGISKYHLQRRDQEAGDSRLLRGILFSRHRADLMHRVSRMNRNKTKEMMKDFFLPSFDDDFSDLVHARKSSTSALSQALKSIGDIDTEATEGGVQPHRQKSNCKMKFVSEEDCSCAGKFRERLQDQGVSIKTGISLGKGLHEGSSMQTLQKNNSEISTTMGLSKSAEDEAKELYNRLSNILNERQKPEECLDRNNSNALTDIVKEYWEPLTMEALVQQGKKTLNVVNSEKWYLT